MLSQRNYTNWLPTHGGYQPGTNLRASDFFIACQNPGFKVFYTFCHGGVTDGYPRGIILESPTANPSLIEPSDIQSLMSGNPYIQKLYRRLIFFNSCNLASDFNQNFQIMRDYMKELGAFGSGTWNQGAMVDYATQISNSIARDFAKKFFERLVNYPSNSMINSFNFAMTNTYGISQAQPTLQGAINTVFENTTYSF